MDSGILDRLAKKDIVTEKNVVDIRQYISSKNPNISSQRSAIIFADAMNKILAVRLANLGDLVNSKFKTYLFQDASMKSSFSINSSDVFKSILKTKPYGNLFFKELSQWISKELDVDIDSKSLSALVTNVYKNYSETSGPSIEDVINNAEQSLGGFAYLTADYKNSSAETNLPDIKTVIDSVGRDESELAISDGSLPVGITAEETPAVPDGIVAEGLDSEPFMTIVNLDGLSAIEAAVEAFISDVIEEAVVESVKDAVAKVELPERPAEIKPEVNKPSAVTPQVIKLPAVKAVAAKPGKKSAEPAVVWPVMMRFSRNTAIKTAASVILVIGMFFSFGLNDFITVRNDNSPNIAQEITSGNTSQEFALSSEDIPTSPNKIIKIATTISNSSESEAPQVNNLDLSPAEITTSSSAFADSSISSATAATIMPSEAELPSASLIPIIPTVSSIPEVTATPFVRPSPPINDTPAAKAASQPKTTPAQKAAPETLTAAAEKSTPKVLATPAATTESYTATEINKPLRLLSPVNPVVAQPQGIQAEPAISDYFTDLLKINGEVIGRIKINGTNIDYPLLQHSDNDYYLKTDINGQASKSACVVVDYRNSKDFSDKNTLIYAHNMKNGSMFHSLVFYKDEDFFNSHRTVNVDTLTESGVWEVFSVYVLDADTERLNINYSQEGSFLKAIEGYKSRSMFQTDVSLSDTDRIITMVTCSYETANSRTIVHAKYTGNGN
ncbi:MAG: class B sortase [Clostridiales bacterium]|nr:class B sortase [Clostridiales bacterium]